MMVPEEVRNRVKSLVSNRCGLYFKDHDLKNLDSAIRQRVMKCGLDTAGQYAAYLTDCVNREDEFRELVNLLTIHHTYFFRNEAQFSFLRERLLPDLVKQKEEAAAARGLRPSLRIWSAGCATGEEIYSIAMIVKEAIGDCSGWDIALYGTDAASSALSRAAQAEYREQSMRLVDEAVRAKYFTISTDEGGQTTYRLDQSIKDLVRFEYFNLAESSYPAGFDIIFCRNVMIYFDLETIVKVIDRFHASLDEQGYLFIGYAESLQFICDKFKMESVPSA